MVPYGFQLDEDAEQQLLKHIVQIPRKNNIELIKIYFLIISWTEAHRHNSSIQCKYSLQWIEFLCIFRSNF
jgi:hypothetical protein